MIARIHQDFQHCLPDLVGILLDAVDSGASVNFLNDLSPQQAEAYWLEKVHPGVERQEIVLFGAWQEEKLVGTKLVGTVQLHVAMPPNQPHRAEVAKLIVHRKARGLGLGAKLLQAAEDFARKQGKTLLLLDTAEIGGPIGFYERCGWTRAGRIPDFALTPDRQLTATILFFKQLHETG